MQRLPTWIVAAASLLLGFGVADLTGLRPLGGIVLFLGALWCGRRWKAERGLQVALVLVGVFLAAFVLSHVLGDVIGAWTSVLVVSAVTAATAWALADRHAPQPGS